VRLVFELTCVDVSIEVTGPSVRNRIISSFHSVGKSFVDQFSEPSVHFGTGLIDILSDNSRGQDHTRGVESFENPLINRHLHPIPRLAHTTTERAHVLTIAYLKEWLQRCVLLTTRISENIFIKSIHSQDYGSNLADPSLLDGSILKIERTPLVGQRARVGFRDAGTKAMYDDTLRGLESPAMTAVQSPNCPLSEAYHLTNGGRR